MNNLSWCRGHFLLVANKVFICHDLHWWVVAADKKCKKVTHKANWPHATDCSQFTWMVVGTGSLVQKKVTSAANLGHTVPLQPLYLSGGEDPHRHPHSPHIANLLERWWGLCPWCKRLPCSKFWPHSHFTLIASLLEWWWGQCPLCKKCI